MTIVQPYRQTPLGIVFFWLLGFVIAGGVLFSIVFHNQLVDLRHDTGEVRKGIERAEVVNVELVSRLSAVTDPTDPEGWLRDRGFTLEGRPVYAEVGEQQISGL